jgi:hypothetical protein
VLVVAPGKFALSFSIGSALVTAAPGALKGWGAHAAASLAPDRLPFTAGYAASLLLTLWASVGLHSYLLSLICCGAQVVALAYYAASQVPGGTAGLRAAGSVAGAALSSVVGAVTRA